MTMHKLPLTRFFICAVFICFLSSCRSGESPETPITGKLTLIADSAGLDAAQIQAEVFSRYYPDATIHTVPAEGSVPLRRGQAALLSRKPQQDSLAVLRVEPVAHDALLVLVNSRSHVRMMTREAISLLFPGLRPFTGKAFKEQIRRVASGRGETALVFRSVYYEAKRRGEVPDGVTVIAISQDGNAVFPGSEEIMNGSYPLVTTLYYVYYPGDALATGLGAWLTDRGQSVFARSGLVPLFEQARTIILN